MTIVYTVDAFERENELLVFEVNIPKEKLPELSEIMGWNNRDYQEFSSGLGGFDIKKEQVLAIEKLLNNSFFREDLDFQISGGEI